MRRGHDWMDASWLALMVLLLLVVSSVASILIGFTWFLKQLATRWLAHL